jgi:hypothetical protein
MLNSRNYYPQDDFRAWKDVSFQKDLPVHLEPTQQHEPITVVHPPCPQTQQASRLRHQDVQRRVSLQLSASLHRSVKRVALEEDETLNSLMVRLLREYINQREQQKRRQR